MFKAKCADLTVIIPFFNNSRTIERALFSVFNQTYLPKKILIIDDKSSKSENNKLIKIIFKIKKIFKKIPIQLIVQKKNFGPGSARNLGWKYSKTSYIAFLDADDSWHPLKTEIQYCYMMNNKNIDISATASTNKYQGTDQNWLLNQNNIKFYNINKNLKLFRNLFTTPTAMLKRSINIRFKEKKFFTEDYLLWLECLFSGYSISYIKSVLVYIHKPALGHSGLSKSIFKMYMGEVDTFKTLLKNKRINNFVYLIIRILIFLKFIKRNITNI
jgi:glycosyltransferase involved in cell wall biosynthesis